MSAPAQAFCSSAAAADHKRAALIDSLMHDIVDGNLTHPRVNLGYVLDQMLDEPLMSNDDVAFFSSASIEQCLDLQDAVQRQARDIVRNWLENEREGRALVALIAEQED